MKKTLLTIVTILYIATHTTRGQTIGGGGAGELSYCQGHLISTLEYKHRLLNTSSEIEMHSSVTAEGGYLFSQHHLHPYVGAGIEYTFQKTKFSYILMSGIETDGFAGGIKFLVATEELGGEASGVLFPWQHHRLGIGFFTEAIPLFHATYTGGFKLCYRVYHEH